VPTYIVALETYYTMIQLQVLNCIQIKYSFVQYCMIDTHDKIACALYYFIVQTSFSIEFSKLGPNVKCSHITMTTSTMLHEPVSYFM